MAATSPREGAQPPGSPGGGGEKGLWRLVSGAESAAASAPGAPALRTLCGLAGRQCWVWEAGAGSGRERRAVEDARAAFRRRKAEHGVKHSGDELLRLQAAGPNYRAKRRLPKAGAAAIEDGAPSATQVEAAMHAGVDFYRTLQCEDGHWPGDYGGPMFLMPGLVITLYYTGALERVLSPRHREEMVRYLGNHQNSDGGYGLHIEGHSTMFGTALNYVTLRLLGTPADAPGAAAARKWIRAHGGPEYCTSWGKFWLAVLGVYEWEGQNPVPPETWLLPYDARTLVGYLHPGRYWCHCRMVYLPMSYIYGKRATCAPTALTRALREELYPGPYAAVDWDGARNLCAPEDLYYPHPWVQDVLWWGFARLEWLYQPGRPLAWLRERALREAYDHVHYEDVNTRFVDIGPVNKVINMLCAYVAGDTESFEAHLPRVYDYLWVAEDGMKMQGYNGSQLWDTAFAVQAVAATGLGPKFAPCLRRAAAYVEASQVLADAAPPLGKYYRHISKGAWPFSTQDHGWPISDCSSEGLKAVIALEREFGEPVVSFARMEDCMNVILSYQNSGGGWATYENTRSFAALELLNPAETFGDIIVDYSYVECSSACITAVAAFLTHCDRAGLQSARFPRARLEEAMRRGTAFIRSIQRADGSWYGSWGVCFTYAAWFGVDALVAEAEATGRLEPGALCRIPEVQRCCTFVLSKQRKDGGWGESYLSCEKKVYSQLPPDEPSHAVNTAWAMLALLKAGQHHYDPAPLHRAAACLLRLQEGHGDWPQQQISGVFNRNCMITYANYRNIFPLWALGEYHEAVCRSG